MDSLHERSQVLVIDDDHSLWEALTVLLDDEWRVLTAATGAEGLALLQQEAIPVVLLDIRLPEMDGLTVLQRIKTCHSATEVLMLTVSHEVPAVVRAMQWGAADFLTKPFDGEVLRARLRVALAQYRGRQPAQLPLGVATLMPGEVVIGQSSAIRGIWHLLQQVADTTATVLLLGESGTGKEHLARALHASSPRRTRPFVAVNCATLPDTLATSLLLGHERGAFTGASRRHIGLVERAHTGTLFLDEIGSLSPSGQAALLRVLQERTFERIGSEATQHVDFRVVAATNQDLRQLVAAKRFREDLWYRLYVVPVEVPALRQRREDIALLAAHFLAQYTTAYHRTVLRFTTAALEALRQYPWPGNVRELEHCIARLVALSPGPLLEVEAVRAALRGP
jgi:DNA-binding NtrC family response regulator